LQVVGEKTAKKEKSGAKPWQKKCKVNEKNQLLKVLLLLVAPGGGLLCHGYVFFRLTMSDPTLYIPIAVCACFACVCVLKHAGS